MQGQYAVPFLVKERMRNENAFSVVVVVLRKKKNNFVLKWGWLFHNGKEKETTQDKIWT